MPAICDDLAAARPDAIDQRAAGTENPAVENGVAGAPGQGDVLRVKADDVGEATLGQPMRHDTQRLRTGLERALRTARDRWKPPARHDVAGAVRQPLRIFELPQFVGTPIRTLESEPMPKRPPCPRNSAASNVPSPRLASVIGTQAGHRAAFRHPADLVIGRMCGVDQAPATIDRDMIEQPLQRTLAAPGHAFLDFPGLFGDMDMNRTVADQAAAIAVSSSGVTARSECGASPTTAPWLRRHGAAARFHQPRKAIDAVDETTLARFGRPSAETGMGVKHRQQVRPIPLACAAAATRSASSPMIGVSARPRRRDG